MSENEFHTLRGYSLMGRPQISNAMEDYLEMATRMENEGKFIRVGQLAASLHVTTPSASKMLSKLKDCGMVEFEPYGIVKLTEQGRDLGAYLLLRHDILHRFFCRINRTENELELVEKIEHFIDERTVRNIEALLPDIS